MGGGLRLESVAVMEATQQNEYKLNVDHQTKQNTIPKMRACVYGLYITKSSLLCMYAVADSGGGPGPPSGKPKHVKVPN